MVQNLCTWLYTTKTLPNLYPCCCSTPPFLYLCWLLCLTTICLCILLMCLNTLDYHFATLGSSRNLSLTENLASLSLKWHYYRNSCSQPPYKYPCFVLDHISISLLLFCTTLLVSLLFLPFCTAVILQASSPPALPVVATIGPVRWGILARLEVPSLLRTILM